MRLLHPGSKYFTPEILKKAQKQQTPQPQAAGFAGSLLGLAEGAEALCESHNFR
jgi:hypothetical protein